MSKDTFDQNCLCYKDDTNRNWFAARLLCASAPYFQRSFSVENFSTLKALVDEADSKPFEEINHGLMFEFAKEALLDDIKLTICFENHAKAVLLKKKYLIHRIDPPKGHAHFNDLANMRKRQKGEPIQIAEFLKYDAIIYDNGLQMNVFPALSQQTISFGKVLREKLYSTVVNLPPNIMSLASEALKHRNTLHYLLGEGVSFSKQTITDLVALAGFVDSEIVGEFNAWCVSSGMPKHQISKCVLK